jgi:hypothetical protein
LIDLPILARSHIQACEPPFLAAIGVYADKKSQVEDFARGLRGVAQHRGLAAEMRQGFFGI